MAEVPLIMPKMSMTMEEGTMVSWLKQPGDAISSGDVVCEVLTDKVDMEVESPVDGVLARIVAEVDQVVRVGDPIAYIESDSDDLLGDIFASVAKESPAAESVPKESTATRVTQSEKSPETAGETFSSTASQGDANAIIPASPLARKLAKDAGLALHKIPSTGPYGTVRVADVKAAVQAGVTEGSKTQINSSDTISQASAGRSLTPAETTAKTTAKTTGDKVAAIQFGELFGDQKFRRTRQAVAKIMDKSAAVPQFTLQKSVDVSALYLLRKTSLKAIGWTAIFVRALALALREHPQLNGFWTDAGILTNADIGVSLAVDTPYGLLVPVLVNPDKLTISDLEAELKLTVENARAGKIDLDKLGLATTTVSNLGGMGVDSFNALLTPPQATALSLGALSEKNELASDGTVISKRIIQLGLTVDHRVADGADGARLLATLQELLTDPIRLLA